MVVSGFGKRGVKLDVGQKTQVHIYEDKGETFMYYLDRLYLITDQEIALFEGDINTVKKRSNKAGRLPKSDPNLVQYLTIGNPQEYIKDQTTDEDLDTLRTTYDGNHWAYRYAVNFWWVSHYENNLTVPQWMKREFVIQQWADQFDKIIRTNKGNQEQLRLVMMWLTQKDEWWIPNGNITSPAKFHMKNKQGETYFQVFLTKALREAPKPPVKGHEYNSFDIEELCEWFGVNPGDFKKKTDIIYLYTGDYGKTTT